MMGKHDSQKSLFSYWVDLDKRAGQMGSVPPFRALCYREALLLYGGGLCLSEGQRLRVKDLSFEEGTVYVRKAKGEKDRRTIFPQQLHEQMKEHLVIARAMHEQDMKDGRDGVYMPNQLDKKYPKASKEWIWQYVFPSKTVQKDPRSGKIRSRPVQIAVKKAAQLASIDKKVTPIVGGRVCRLTQTNAAD